MNTATVNVFQSNYGFHACDRETYKKIKRIRHLIEQCKGRNNRFDWFWRKAPQNRTQVVWTAEKTCTRQPMQEPKLFELFYAKTETKMADWQRKACGYTPEQYRYHYTETKELHRFMETYAAARYPVKKAEDVKTLKHTVEELDTILAELTEYIG